MDPLHLCIAMGPLSVYLLLIGRLNLRRHPSLTTGTRDFIALSIAISGFVISGPLELFMPETAAVFFRFWIWPPLICLYFLCAILLAMLMRPRLVIYNMTAQQLRPILEAVATQVDSRGNWAGHSLVLPQLGVQLHIEAFPAMRNVQLIAVGHNQDLNGWRHLRLQLREALRNVQVKANPRGFSFVFFGLFISGMIAYAVASEPREVAKALYDFLRL